MRLITNKKRISFLFEKSEKKKRGIKKRFRGSSLSIYHFGKSQFIEILERIKNLVGISFRLFVLPWLSKYKHGKKSNICLIERVFSISILSIEYIIPFQYTIIPKCRYFWINELNRKLKFQNPSIKQWIQFYFSFFPQLT